MPRILQNYWRIPDYSIKQTQLVCEEFSNNLWAGFLFKPYLSVTESPQSPKLKTDNIRYSNDISSTMDRPISGGGAQASLSETNTSADDLERLRKELCLAREQILSKYKGLSIFFIYVLML